MKNKLFLLLMVGLLSFTLISNAKDWQQSQKFTASERTMMGLFGNSVSYSDSLIIVGEPGSNKAHIFVNRNSELVLLQTLSSSDVASGDNFGQSVAISGNLCIVGAYREGEDVNNENTLSKAGSVYIFKRNDDGSWSQVQKLVASDRAASAYFGYSVAISGDYAIVGAYKAKILADDGTTELTAGAAYIFHDNGTTWEEVKKLTSSGKTDYGSYGYSVAISGNNALVGANSENEAVGAAYLYTYDGNDWGETKLPVDEELAFYFGSSVAISGDYAIVGATYSYTADYNGWPGNAYVYHYTGTAWELQKTLSPSDWVGEDQFGYSVAISDDYAVVGAYACTLYDNDENSLNNAGVAYVYGNNNGSWDEMKKITATDYSSSSNFGSSVAISGENIIVGAYKDQYDANGENYNSRGTGSAYLFEYAREKFPKDLKNICLGSQTIFDAASYNFTDPENTTVSAYKWQLNTGTGFTDVIDGDLYSGTSKDTLTVPSVVLSMDSTYFRCLMTTNQGEIISDTAILTVDSEVPEITDYPEMVEVLMDSYGLAVLPDYSDTITVTDNCSAEFTITQQPVAGTTLSADTTVTLTVADAAGNTSEVTFNVNLTQWGNAQTMVAKDLSGSYYYGYDIDVEDSLAIVGSTDKVYFLKSTDTGWEETQMISPYELNTKVLTAISGDYAMVSCEQDKTDLNNENELNFAGSAYIYSKNNDIWEQGQKLVASDRAEKDYFGHDIAMDGNYAVVSAYGKTVNGLALAGAVYVYHNNNGTWEQQQIITAPEPAANEQFGISVDISGDYFVASTSSTATYVYQLKTSDNSWKLNQSLTVSSVDAKYFKSVAISDDYLIIGSYYDKTDANGENSKNYAGSAFIFHNDGAQWTEQQKMVPDDRIGSAYFGYSVALAGNDALIGAYKENAAYIFSNENGTWEQQQKLVPENSAGDFGWSVALTDKSAFVSAHSQNIVTDEGTEYNAGEVYTYSFSGAEEGGNPFEVQPEHQTNICIGSTVGYKVTAPGASAYQWQMSSGTGFSDITDGDSYSGVTTDSLTVLSVSPEMNGYRYRCLATIAGVVFESDSVLLATDSEAPEITSVFEDVILEGDENSEALLSDYTTAVTATDNCSSELIITQSPEAGSTISGLNTTVTISVSDEAGNESRVSFFVSVPNTNLGTWNVTDKLVASDRLPYDILGKAVCIYGDYAIVGTNENDDYIGAAYIYHNSGENWKQVQKLEPSDAAPEDRFATSVAITDEYAIVGAVFEDEDVNGENYLLNAGSVYIYKKNDDGTWTEVQKITAEERKERSSFGTAVAIYGNDIVIGSSETNYDNEENKINSGAAYIFHYNGSSWVQQQRLASSIENSSDFGETVAIDGNYMVIGATYTTALDSIDNTGVAYIYKYNSATSNWDEQQLLVPSDGADNDYFGKSVAISGDYLVVGASNKETNGLTKSGAAYMYYNNGTEWVEKQKMTASNPNADDNFGFSVSMYGDYAVIGAVHKNADGVNWAGKALLFYNSGNKWEEMQQISSPTPAEADFFGYAVSIDEKYVLVGCYQDDFDANGENEMADAGAAYLFKYVTNPVNITAQPENQSGVCIGSIAEFKVGAEKAMAFQWQVDSGAGFVDIIDGDVYSGATTDTLTVLNVSSEMNRNDYQCLLYNLDGEEFTTEAARLLTDSEIPVITSMHNTVTLAGDANGEAVLPDYKGDVVATDNCSTSDLIVITQSPEVGTTISGDYTVTLKAIDAAGNEAKVRFTVSVSTGSGIASLAENGIFVYPNPTDGQLFIDSDLNVIKSLKVLDLTGKTILQKSDIQSKEMIDLTLFEGTVFILNIQMDEGVITTKIVKQ